MVLPKIKRARKANFSSLETSVLLEEYAAEKDLLQCSFSTEVTNKKKRAAWEVIQNRVNACGVAYRTVEELKEKWGGLKRGVKDRIRDQKVTGGGKPLPTADFEEVVVRIIGEDSAIFDGLDGESRLLRKL